MLIGVLWVMFGPGSVLILSDFSGVFFDLVTQPPKTVPPTMCEFSETGEAGRLVKKGGMVEVYFFEEWVVLEVKQVGNRRS